MFCLKCGKEIENGAKFCPHCGAMTSAAPAQEPSAPQAPVYTIPDFNTTGTGGASPAPEGKKRRGGIALIGAAVAAVLVVVLAVFAITSLFSSPKGQVEKALAKTAAAYAAANEKAGAADLAKLLQDKSYSQRFSVSLDSVNEDLTGWYGGSYLKGFGLRMAADYDQKGRKMDFDMAVIYDGDDLASFQMLVNDSVMSFASPEFTKGDAYGFNTENLGADLYELGLEDDDIDVKKIGFNLFDLMDLAVPSEEDTKAVEKIMADANKALLDAVEVEKTGKQKVDVNGKSTDATLYHVVISKDAMKDYINAFEDAMKTADTTQMLEDLYLAMGFDKATVREIMSQLDTADVYGQMADMMKQAVKTIGDVELDVYIAGGYVCAVEYSDKINGTKVEIGLYLGGGDSYVDDLSLEIAVGSQKITVESTGDHSAKSGAFTDETVIRSGSDRITSDLSWEPNASSGNFEWELKLNNTGSLSMEGQLTTTSNSIDLQLDDLSIKAMGSKLVSLEMEYYLGPCNGMQVSMSSPTLLADMDEDDFMDLYYDIQENAEDWVYDVMDRLPSDLYDAFRYMF